jgi:hypothetical protein
VGSITYILEFGRVFIALIKPRRQALPASFCGNIVTHERKDFFKKYLFHAHYVMLDILIFKNEGIAKLFTLVLKGSFE